MNKLNTNKLNFSPENNNAGNGHWITDWSTLRRYVLPTGFIRVWEGGSVELYSALDGRPDDRALAMRYGIDIMPRDDLPEVRTVEGVKLAKAWLDKEMYVVDYPSRRVFAVSGVPDGMNERYGHTRYSRLGYLLRWVHPNSVPYSTYSVRGFIPDRKKAKQWLEMNRDMLLTARGIAALEGGSPTASFDGLVAALTSITPSHQQMKIVGVYAGSSLFNKVVARITAQRLEVPHLMLA